MAAASDRGGGMSGLLAAFQSDLGRALQGEDCCPIDSQSVGFRFTMTIRRSWRLGRAIMAARAVVSVMPDDERQRLVNEYVDRGGGSEMFLERESEAFLAFLALRLPNPSHALTLCQMQQALARARLGASTFVLSRRCAAVPVRRGRYAALVWFYADPAAVMAAIPGGKLPPVGPPDYAVLFAPGLANLFRPATIAETALWATLPVADAPVALIAPLLMKGVLEYSDRDDDDALAPAMVAESRRVRRETGKE
jgi:hypothetical protein